MTPPVAMATTPADTKTTARTPSVEDQVAAAFKLIDETKNAEDFLSNLPLIIEGYERQLAKAEAAYAHATEEFKKWNDLQNTPNMETATKTQFIGPMKTFWTSETERLRGETGTLRRNVVNLRVLLDFQTKA